MRARLLRIVSTDKILRFINTSVIIITLIIIITLTLSLPWLPLSLLKRPINVTNLKSLMPFSPSHKHMKGFLSKFTVLKVDLLQYHQIYCLHACTYALFSQESFQAGAVKGLIIIITYEDRRRQLRAHRDASGDVDFLRTVVRGGHLLVPSIITERVHSCQHTPLVNTGTWLSTHTSGQHGYMAVNTHLWSTRVHGCQHIPLVNKGTRLSSQTSGQCGYMAVNTHIRSPRVHSCQNRHLINTGTWLSEHTSDQHGYMAVITNIRSTRVHGCQHRHLINTGTCLSTCTADQHGYLDVNTQSRSTRGHGCQHRHQVNTGHMIVNTHNRSTGVT